MPEVDIEGMSWSGLVVLKQEIEREILFRLASNDIAPRTLVKVLPKEEKRKTDLCCEKFRVGGR